MLGAHDAERPLVEIGAAVRRARSALLVFLRRTRYGLIIRAGVENRAMVTALGIDVRKAFTLVFAIGGVAAALAGVLSGVYFGTDRPGARHALLIFAFIVVVIGGLGSITRHGGRRGGRRARAAVRELLRLVGHRRPRGRSLLLALVLLVRPGGLAGKWQVAH